MYGTIKRLSDLLFSIVAIVVLLPIFLLIIIGIEISDPGPVFYKARRVGYQGKEFTMYKFRSMRIPKTEDEKSEASFKADNNRIFAFGRLIRRLKIDELAQILNLVNGTMAIVGPRPASVDQVSIMREGKYAIANTVKPGLTGPAALYDYIYGDTVEDLEEYKRLVLPTRRELEAYYPTHLSAGFDIKMIWWTVVCVFSSMFKKQPKIIFNKLIGYVNADKRQEEVSNV